MNLDSRTLSPLATADRKAQIARLLLQPGALAPVQPPPTDWAVVFAFYAAVHYVNAFLWERQRHEPRTHDDREAAVARAVELRSVLHAYQQLRVLAQRVRYTPGYRPARALIQVAVLARQEAVAQTVRSTLGLQP